jgi:hypothetical protein
MIFIINSNTKGFSLDLLKEKIFFYNLVLLGIYYFYLPLKFELSLEFS